MGIWFYSVVEMGGGEAKWNCRSVCNTAGFSISSDGILLLIAGNRQAVHGSSGAASVPGPAVPELLW